MRGLGGWTLARRVLLLALAAALPAPTWAADRDRVEGPAGYQVVNAVGSGRALATRKPQVKAVGPALRATLADLERFFGRKLQVRGAYEDTRDHRSGGAGFRVEPRGRPLQGLISCRIEPEGAVIAVVYAGAEAPRSEWVQLLRARPDAGGRPAVEPSRRPAVAGVPLRTYRFPDGTGSIGLAEGWRTDAQSCAGPVQVQGPADQSVSMGLAFSISTPDSMAAQTQRQLVANARQMGTQPPTLDMLIAPYGGPLEALRSLAPQLSQISTRHGGPPFQVDHLALAETLPPNLPGGQAARLTYGISERGRDGRVRHYRAEAYAETGRLGPGGWTLMAVVLKAPDASFQRDLPAMRAMVFSLQENAQAIQQKTQQAIAAQNQWFQAQQRAHRQQVEGFEARQKAHREVTEAMDRKNRGWEQNQNALARSHDDYDEVPRGYRTVEDTRSGTKTSVDLGNVDVIVDKLNEADPGRYRQIPLRDELDPLPGR